MVLDTSVASIIREAVVGRSVDPYYNNVGPSDRMELEVVLSSPLRPELIGRLMVEAQESVSSELANVLRVYWISAEPERVLLSIDRLPGDAVRLDDWVRQVNKGQARLPPATAAEIVVRIAETVEQIHKRGPWLGRPRAHGSISARTVIADGSGRARLIGDGMPGLGALLLANPDAELDRDQAPEQVRGEPIDERTDVYALGALYYQLLSHKTYRERADGDQWVLAALERRAPDLPGDLPVVRPTLLALLHRALAPHPAARFPTVAAFCRALIADLREACLPATTSEAIADQLAALGDSVKRGPAVLGYSRRSLLRRSRPPRPVIEGPRAIEERQPVIEEIRAEDLVDPSPDPRGVIDLWIRELGEDDEPPPPVIDPDPPQRIAAFAEDLAPIELHPTQDLNKSGDLAPPPQQKPLLALVWILLLASGIGVAYLFWLLSS